MNKSKLNLIIDIVLVVLMAGLSGIGFLIKYVLPCGNGMCHGHGGGQNTTLELMGMNKHAWADMHAIVGFLFIFFIIVHLILHWKSIQGMFKHLIPNETARTITITVLLIIVLLLMGFPFVCMP